MLRHPEWRRAGLATVAVEGRRPRMGLLHESRRSGIVESFKVMDVLKRAKEMEATGREVYHLEVGQPKSGAPASAVRAASSALASGEALGYTPANGLESLRLRIARWYRERHGARVDPERVVVTTGSSSGFVVAFSALFDAGDAVAVPSTAYPCYRNVLRALGCEPVSVRTSNEKGTRAGFGFPTPGDLARLADERARLGLPKVKGLVLSSPANPTGAVLDRASLVDLADACRDRDVRFVSDEIYHHLFYDPLNRPETAVDLDRAVVINSFSKYFSMTGWRVGWLVLPGDEESAPLARAVDKLQQNLAICAPNISQVAATAAFDDTDAELADHVRRYAANRRVVLDGLHHLGLDPHLHIARPDGAFYVYADLSDFGVTDSAHFCAKLLADTGVAITPGLDFEFDPRVGSNRVRFSYCGDSDQIVAAMDKLAGWWPSRPTTSTLRP